MKENYIKYAKDTFTGEILEVVLNQIDLFYSNISLEKHNYSVGQLVELKAGTFIHGVNGELESLDWVLKNGFVSSNFTDNNKPNKYFNSVGMWNIKEDKLLKEYIIKYSGMTIAYSYGRGPGSKKITELISYNQIENKLSSINNDKEIWSWYAEQTKEIRFIPSLASDKVQLAFILNMESEEAKKMKYADIFNKDFDKDCLKYFIVDAVLNDFINEERDSFTTDREAAIMFGLPSSLIEGVLVGRKIEKDAKKIEYIKQKLPNAYICNLDGIVI